MKPEVLQAAGALLVVGGGALIIMGFWIIGSVLLAIGAATLFRQL